MNCTACQRQLHDFVDHELTANDATAVTEHLAHCARCREELHALQALRARAAALPNKIAPSRDLWPELQTQLTRDASAPAAQSISRRAESRPLIAWFAPLAIAAAIAFLCTIADRGFASRAPTIGWSVEALAGAPQVDRQFVRKDAKLRVGQWLVTDATSRAKVSVGDIGHVTVAPNSRLRLVDVAATNHRLQLDQGSLSAFIWAPPRIFFVNTPSATAVDYGCAYTLSVDDEGNGELQVTLGYVKLEHENRESIIPMGMMCLTRNATGPGTPFASNASGRLRAAITRFDFGAPDERADSLAEILAHAGEQDRITLWHLLDRAERGQRAPVFDALARLSPLPAGVTREGILSGDRSMLHAWGSHLGLSVALP